MDTEDLSSMPLRPVNFLNGNLKYSILKAEYSKEDDIYDPESIHTIDQAREALAFSEEIADKFWEKWKTEYLTTLRDTQKANYKQRRHGSTIPEIGDIILIKNELLPRGQRSIGKIVDTVKNADGPIRSGKVLTANGKILLRPIAKLFPLEINTKAKIRADREEGDNNLEVYDEKNNSEKTA
uniref:DUF5641 domain-containing protein n=1 Tax=Heterorhabditis bacteriophora TaxID=37862 RepID=A0A1I7XEJ1_HETBA